MSDTMQRVEDTLAGLTAAIDHAEQQMDEGRWQVEAVEALKEFGPGGKWQYAPSGARDEAARRLRAEQEQRAACALTPMDRTLRSVDGLLTEAVAQGEEPPDVLTVWQSRNGGSCASREVLACYQLEEQLVARLRVELPQLAPRALATLYEKALAEPSDVRSAALVRFVEREFLTGRLKPTTTGTRAEAVELQRLENRIREVRAARVPTRVRQLAAQVARARLLSEDGHKRRGLAWWQGEPAKAE